MPDNYFIADQFSLLSKLMDIHNENSFKAKSYAAAAFNIEKIPEPLETVPAAKLAGFKGIGDSAAKKIVEILQTGKLQALEDLIQKTPSGVLEMLNIKGIGPKKIAIIWKEMEIESLGELLYACQENRLQRYKGFGEKTQANVRDAIEFYFSNQGHHLFSETESFALQLDSALRAALPDYRTELTGEFRRQLEIIHLLEWCSTATETLVKEFFESRQYPLTESQANRLEFSGPGNIRLCFHLCSEASFTRTLLETSCSESFLEACASLPTWEKAVTAPNEKEFFNRLGKAPVPAFLREDPWPLAQQDIPPIIQPSDIRGIIHSHSNWSDGSHTIEAMAQACIERGLEYLVISDHSKSAFYANGLSEEKIREQHRYVDELNDRYAPFKIFKSIESDILSDGSLDYSDNILSSFDLVIASVHSNLKMTREKAMARLLRAIENPFTTILGHPTGRLLLSRPGYPVDHPAMIEACIRCGVAIELNAHPRRLDMDWRWIHQAQQEGALISIDPDAHSTEGFEVCRFGVLAAQKAGLSPAHNLSSFPLAAFETYLQNRKARKL